MDRSDPGSFRDPASRVVSGGVLGADSVLRLLDDRGLADWRRLAASPFFAAVVADGRLIDTTEVEAPPGAAGALRHPRLPLVTYPYEWTFTMLRDAALLQLDLITEALADGLMLKDATPYNIQFVGGRPRFIDVGSFEGYRTGEPWLGYRQFCRQFLYPLMLRAWVGIPFQPWLRGQPDGPTAEQMRRLLPARRRLNGGALLHVELGARAEAKLQGAPVRSALAEAGFTVDLILHNVSKLKALVAKLDWDGSEGSWADYHGCGHVSRDRSAKSDFLAEAVDRVQPRVVVDLGANDGHFSLVAARAGTIEAVAAVDGDEAVLDRLYRSLPAGSAVVPVLTDLSNPSPSQGWAGIERPALFERTRPDLVVAYGLIHHLTYTASIPPALVVDWLASFGVPVVVEFVAPSDPMVARLTANKRPEELHPDRTRDDFERLVGARFSVRRHVDLEGGTRRLYELEPRADA